MQTRRRGGREVCFRERALLCRLRRFPSNNCHAEKWVVRRREKSHNVLFVGPVQRLRAEAFACPSVRQTGSLAIVRYYLSRSLIRALLLIPLPLTPCFLSLNLDQLIPGEGVLHLYLRISRRDLSLVFLSIRTLANLVFGSFYL